MDIHRRKIELGYLKETTIEDEKNNGGKKMTKKTYTVSITYVGEIEAENEDEVYQMFAGQENIQVDLVEPKY